MALGIVPMSAEQIRLAKERPAAFLAFHWLYWTGAAALVALCMLAIFPNTIPFAVQITLAAVVMWGSIIAVLSLWNARRQRA